MSTIQKHINNALRQDFGKLDVMGRNLIGLSFIILGLIHLFSPTMLVMYVPALLFPFKVLAVMVSGLLFIAAGVCFVLERHVYEAAMYLALFLAFLAIVVLLPMSDVAGFFTNIALIGALLTLADKYDSTDRTIRNFFKRIMSKLTK